MSVLFLSRCARLSALLLLTLSAVAPAEAAFTKYDTETYDSETLGVPKFVDTIHIDMRKITQISKFRSDAGHDYSDGTQFGTADGLSIPGIGVESCSSMKHYFIAPDASVKIYAPTSGIVSRRFDEGIGGTQIQITSDVQPAFTFIIFHVELTGDFPEGAHVDAGELLGHHTGTQTFSDIAVEVHTPKGYHLVSYFETLTDKAFAVFQARGVTSRDQLIYTREQRAADKFQCAGSAFINFKTPPENDYFTLTGGAATQTIAAPAATTYVKTIGDAATTFAATASSGLPVTLTSNAPKVCATSGLTVTWRRPGMCILTLSQAGNDDVFPAPSISYNGYVYPAGRQSSDLSRLGGVFPPGSATQSLIRLYNPSSSTPAKISLFDGTTGEKVLTWTSPAIPRGTAQQFSIADLESAALPGFKRPAFYGLKVEATGAAVWLQHVLFNPAAGVITNASSCSNGISSNPNPIFGVHSSVIGGYPSTMLFANVSGVPGIFPTIQILNESTGAQVGLAYAPESPDHSAIKPNAQYTTTSLDFETRMKVVPDAATLHYIFNTYNYGFPRAYTAHLVANSKADLISDMTVQCASPGRQTVLSPLLTANVYSGGNTAQQSFLRFYNPGPAAAPVTVTLHETTYGAAVGQWTSPDIPVGAELQYAVSTIEDAIVGLTKQQVYTVTVDTTIDGSFQHVYWRAPNGALSNASTCAGSSTIDPTTLISVHSSALAAGGYPSTVIINNTGTVAATATLGVYDATTGARLGVFSTASIPANAQLQLDSAALENKAGITNGGSYLHYVVKLEGSFTGFLQHYVTSNGIVTDMSLICAM